MKKRVQCRAAVKMWERENNSIVDLALFEWQKSQQVEVTRTRMSKHIYIDKYKCRLLDQSDRSSWTDDETLKIVWDEYKRKIEMICRWIRRRSKKKLPDAQYNQTIKCRRVESMRCIIICKVQSRHKTRFVKLTWTASSKLTFYFFLIQWIQFKIYSLSSASFHLIFHLHARCLFIYLSLWFLVAWFFWLKPHH